MQTKTIITYISDWLKQYSEKSKIKGLVVGISGGIDSAVSSTLAAKTGLPVLCVEMPIHQEESQVERGKDHINWLKNNFPNVSAINIELTSVFENLAKTLPKNTENVELALANTRARLRMTTLYYLAGTHNYLVVGTGNKVEDFGVGFFTKYGGLSRGS